MSDWVSQNAADKEKVLAHLWGLAERFFTEEGQTLLPDDHPLTEVRRHFLPKRPPYKSRRSDWVKKFEDDWQTGQAFKDKATFFSYFEHISVLEEPGVVLGILPKRETIRKPVAVSKSQITQLQDYVKHIDVSIAALMGSTTAAELPEAVYSGVCAEGDLFVTHSPTKVFTGVLMLKLLQEGIITGEDLTAKPIRLKPSTTARLESYPKILARMAETSTLQALTHKTGLGVGEAAPDMDYVGNYRRAVQKVLDESSGHMPEITGVEDFIPFIPNEVSLRFGGEHPPEYSNSGMIIGALSLEYLYEQYRVSNAEKELPALDYNGLLYQYITGPSAANLTVFRPSLGVSETLKHAEGDRFSEHLAGSPAGGYFSTLADLSRFAIWLNQQCQDAEFIKLVERYAEEFCPHPAPKTIEHAGNGRMSSAFFSLNWESGNAVVVF